MDGKQTKLVISLAGLGVSAWVAYRMVRFYEQLTAPSAQVQQGTAMAERLLARGVDQLNEYERAVCADLVFREDLSVGFDDVAGLDHVKQGLRDVIAPFEHPDRYASRLMEAPKGVLLYGPPGNGKSMLASALARECGASFINLKSSTLFQKYVGESEKMALAVFSLARKIEPCIVFIDEIDLVLSRDAMHVAHNKVIGILLAEWDGLSSSAVRPRVVVVAASNNPKNIETALHRRMPRQFHLGPPDAAQRRRILVKILRDDPQLTVAVSDALLGQLATATDRYCGSDLLELCKVALSQALRDGEDQFRWIHFKDAMKCVKYAGASADEQLFQEYRAGLE